LSSNGLRTASIQPQQSATSMASLGVIDLRPESTLWILIQSSSFFVVVLAEPLVKTLGVLELADFVGINLYRRHQPNSAIG
jgi:hypothetical protein